MVVAMGSGPGGQLPTTTTTPVLGSGAANIMNRGSTQCHYQGHPRGPRAALQAELGDTKGGPSLRVSPTTPILQSRSLCIHRGCPQAGPADPPYPPLFGAMSPLWCTLTQAVGCGQQQEQQRAHGAGAELRVRAQGGGQEPCPPRRTRLRPPTTHIPALPQPRGKQVGLVSLQSIMLRPGARRVVLLSAVTLVARVGPKGPSPKGCLWGGRTHVLVSPQHGERSIELCMRPKITEPSQRWFVRWVPLPAATHRPNSTQSPSSLTLGVCRVGTQHVPVFGLKDNKRSN